MVELFKMEQSYTETTIEQLMGGGTLRTQGLSRRRKAERIKRIERKYEDGDYTLYEYVTAISRRIGF